MSNIRSRPARSSGRPMQRRPGGGGSSNGGSNNGRRPSNGGSNGRRPGGENISVGNAVANRERYMEKAKEALSYGDRVSAENFFQHADHYNRIVILSEEKKQYDDANSINKQVENAPSEVTAEVTGNVEEKTAEIEVEHVPAKGNGLDSIEDSIGNLPEGAVA